KILEEQMGRKRPLPADHFGDTGISIHDEDNPVPSTSFWDNSLLATADPAIGLTPEDIPTPVDIMVTHAINEITENIETPADIMLSTVTNVDFYSFGNDLPPDLRSKYIEELMQCWKTADPINCANDLMNKYKVEMNNLIDKEANSNSFYCKMIMAGPRPRRLPRPPVL
ncbi:growth hormone, partial [Lasius niger]